MVIEDRKILKPTRIEKVLLSQNNIDFLKKTNKRNFRMGGFFRKMQNTLSRFYAEHQLIVGGYYILTSELRSGHREGDGGEFETLTTLKRDDSSLLILQNFYSYQTTLDDSMDYSYENYINVFLVKEDPNAKKIFNEISQLIPRADEVY